MSEQEHRLDYFVDYSRPKEQLEQQSQTITPPEVTTTTTLIAPEMITTSPEDVDAGREKNHDRAEVMAYAGKALTEEAMSHVIAAEDAAIDGLANDALDHLANARKASNEANSQQNLAGRIYDEGQAILGNTSKV